MKNKILIIFIIINTILNVFFIYNHLLYKAVDVNKDGKVNSLDLLIVQKYILENKEG